MPFIQGINEAICPSPLTTTFPSLSLSLSLSPPLSIHLHSMTITCLLTMDGSPSPLFFLSFQTSSKSPEVGNQREKLDECQGKEASSQTLDWAGWLVKPGWTGNSSWKYQALVATSRARTLNMGCGQQAPVLFLPSLLTIPQRGQGHIPATSQLSWQLAEWTWPPLTCGDFKHLPASRPWGVLSAARNHCFFPT